MDPARLRRTFESRHTCVRIPTGEETETVRMVLDCAADMKLEPYLWSVTTGIRPARLADSKPMIGTDNPGAALAWWRSNVKAPSMCITLDLLDFFDDKRVLRAWRELVEFFHHGGAVGELEGKLCLAMIDHSETSNPSILAASTVHHVAPPDDVMVEEIARQTLRRINRRTPLKTEITKQQFDAIVDNLRGLSRRQVEQVMASAVATDKTLDATDIMNVVREKRRLLQTSGLLEHVDVPASIDEVGGLRRLKGWLAQRGEAFGEHAAEFGLVPPRGVLLLGVQGAGKSLTAKAIAAAWKRPLMKLDPSVLYDKYVGESERRLREALAQAEAMSPVVLWIDEIEKGFASASSTSNDGGLSRRMFGTMLNWMQEHRSPVFLVATANDIEALPPELLRKGRFDEIFFVDLPGAEAREQILRIHLSKRKLDPAAFDLASLVVASEGYSGAEIEQAVLAAMHSVFAARRTDPGAFVKTADVLQALRESPPLSVTMGEKVAELRSWAAGRCVPAD
jgi:SpoVK/Ycf46/Vps4 family AAA+-type ATPase